MKNTTYIAQVSAEGWVDEWPTVPGDYLFYGCSRRRDDPGFSPRLCLVRVRLAGPEGHRFIMRSSSSEFFYESSHDGVWKRIVIDLPVIGPRKEGGEHE